MLKAASVELASAIIKRRRRCLVSVDDPRRRSAASRATAVEAGAEAAGRLGDLKAAHVIPRPGAAVVAAFGAK